MPDVYNFSREGYLLAQNIALISYCNCTMRKAAYDSGGVWLHILSWHERVLPNYNVMGVAKAALEASVGIWQTIWVQSESGLMPFLPGLLNRISQGHKGLCFLHEIYTKKLRSANHNIQDWEIQLFLMSDLSRAITGEVIHVDAGYHILG